MNNSSFIRKIGIYFIGNFSSKMFSALLIPIYAFYVSSRDLGYFDYYQSIMLMLAPILVVAIWESILKFVLNEQTQKRKNHVIRTGVLFSLAMLTISYLLSMMFFLIFFNNYNSWFLLINMILLYTLGQIWLYSTRALQKNKIFAMGGIISTGANLLFILLFIIIFNFGLKGLLLSFFLGQLTLIIYLEKKTNILKLVFKNEKLDVLLLKRMLKYSAPLVLNLVSIWGLSSFGRFIIIYFLGAEMNGVYSFANKFSLIVNMLGTIVNMAFIEEALIANKDSDFRLKFENQVNNMMKIFMEFCLILIPAIVIFYKFLGNTDYNKSLILVFPLIMYAILNIISTNVATVYQAKEQTNILLFTTVIGALVNVVFSIVFINILGIWSIILGQIIGSFTMLLTRTKIAKLKFSIDYNWKVFFLLIVIYFSISFICFNNGIWINILFGIGLLMYYLLKYKKNLYQLANMFRNGEDK
ncbi:lipopolysaccharide biosynthesis protein [Enterococcus casseliflavus]|uniref:lipopolysaccharide biosynthesis protein n=1 Tax=Enterococcus casseliflavus TaxID=37734 RepID=UPI00289023A8|nr:lipopolysaccharide biosynthesis protein [Enterococcus casseliflavus]MDT2971953.1 lipopolysaccharide biosynthesis protein [Enterococcus casseliflavus]